MVITDSGLLFWATLYTRQHSRSYWVWYYTRSRCSAYAT